jgi:endonuclease/exonuclease/phosphatase family metal-dependent hydrolase
MQLRVMTFNVLGCRGFPLESGGPVSFPEVSPALVKALAERLVQWRADVVILQEAPPEADVRQIAKLAGMQAAYFPAQSRPNAEWPFGFPGAVLSKYPLSEIEDRATAIRTPDDERFQRHWGSATVTLGNRTLCVQGMHLCADWGGVKRESTRLSELEAVLTQPAGDLIGADCNTRPGEAPWRRLKEAGWRDAWIEASAPGDGLTSDTRNRIQRIDFLWLAPKSKWRAIRAEVLGDLRVVVDGVELLLSDHHPVAVDLAWGSPGAPR